MFCLSEEYQSVVTKKQQKIKLIALYEQEQNLQENDNFLPIVKILMKHSIHF